MLGRSVENTGIELISHHVPYQTEICLCFRCQMSVSTQSPLYAFGKRQVIAASIHFRGPSDERCYLTGCIEDPADDVMLPTLSISPSRLTDVSEVLNRIPH